MLVLAFLFVLMPFLFWQSTWFGRPLTEEDLAENFADTKHPRKVQHALAQIADRMVRGDASVKRWYPQVLAQASSPVAELRTTAAWVMGQDNSAFQFHPALKQLLADSHPMVRRNAALALVRFGDDSGHDEVVALLRLFEVKAPESGALDQRLQPGDTVNPGTLLGRLRSGENEIEVRSEVPGTLDRWLVSEGASVQAGQGIVALGPDQTSVWEALRALVIIGREADVPVVERYIGSGASAARGHRFASWPDAIHQQARETLRAIRARAAE